jgi:hypothetical protein
MTDSGTHLSRLKLTVVLGYYEAMETYSRIGLLRSYRNLQSYWTTTKLWNLQSYWTTTKPWKLTVVLDYYEAMELTVVLDWYETMETYSPIGKLTSLNFQPQGLCGSCYALTTSYTLQSRINLLLFKLGIFFLHSLRV